MVNSRSKGANFETKICKMLKDLTNRRWTRTPGSGSVATRTGNMRVAGDVMPVNFKCDYVFECKKYKDYNIEGLLTQKGDMWKWFEQLKREKKKKKGVLIFARNYGKIFVLAETDEVIKNTFKFNEYVLGLFDVVMPVIMKEYIR